MRHVIAAVLIGCGVPHGPPSTRGEILSVPPEPSPSGAESGLVRFRQTIITLGSSVPIKATGSQMEYELRRAGTTALVIRNSYELVAGAWKPTPAEHLREQLAVVETGDVMWLTGPADKAAVVCQRQRVRVHRETSVASLKCSRSDKTDPRATWSGEVQEVTAWSCSSDGGFDHPTWIGLLGPLEFSDDVDLEWLEFECLVNTDAPIPDDGLRIIAPGR